MKIPNLRASFKTAVSYGLRLTGVDRLVGTLTGTSKIPLVISYHRVVENFEESSQSSIASMLISTRMLEQHLDWVGRHYEFVSLDDIGRRLENGTGSKKPVAAVAFDDGYSDVYHNAFPLLVKKGIPATVFVVTGLVGTQQMQIHDKLYLLLKSAFSDAKQTSGQVVELLRNADMVMPGMETIGRMQPNPFFIMAALLDDVPQTQVNRMIQVLEARFGLEENRYHVFSSLSWEMLEEMQSAGMTIGSHTRTHALLTNESREKVIEETTRSRRDLEERLCVKVKHFAYPDGRHNANVTAAVAEAGYRFAYGTCGQRDPEYPLLTIPRKVLWEKSSVDSHGRFSSAVIACQMNGAFDLRFNCAHDHGMRTPQTTAAIQEKAQLSRR
jgi:peptidoglycan/xylan/chitin deacetylase (PgdA/CDA1 family)